MVDDLTNESFQTGKAIVTVSVDLITAIAEAIRKSQEQNPALSGEQKDSLLKKVVDKVATNYKETHGSLKSFNREGKDVTHIDVSDERTAQILKDVCRKSHIPIDLQEVERADGSKTFTAFCEVKNIDQVAALLKNVSEQVLEEQQAMTKEVVLYNDRDEAVYSQSFVRDSDIDYDKLSEAAMGAVRLEIKDNNEKVIDGGVLEGDVKAQVKEKAEKLNPKKKKSLPDRIKEKREQSKSNDKDKNRERTKQKKKNREESL